MSNAEFHRYGGHLVSGREWEDAPDTLRRVRLALGPEPVPDARHLLPPVPVPPPAPPLPDGPHPLTEFIVDYAGPFPLPADVVRATFAWERRGRLGVATVWAQQTVPRGVWNRLDDIHSEGRFTAVAVAWELSNLLSEGTEAVAELAGFVLRAGELGKPLGLSAVPREEPADAAHRAARLNDLRLRHSRSVELRLLPRGRAFPARAVWRSAYALGLTWGDLDLFHWHNPGGGERLFTLSAVGHPGYFLPERAAEGEGTAGIALGFELPRNPSPLATYDRMGVALSYFRQHLGGVPVTPDGAELDADRLWDDRDALNAAIHDLASAGIAPGSPEAERLF